MFIKKVVLSSFNLIIHLSAEFKNQTSDFFARKQQENAFKPE